MLQIFICFTYDTLRKIERLWLANVRLMSDPNCTSKTGTDDERIVGSQEKL